VVISGASGLVGSALAAFLQAGGHRVDRLVRRERRGPGEIRWDPASGAIDAVALEGADAVVHLAGPGIGDKRWTEERKADLRDARVDGTTLLVEALVTLGAPPAVLLSGSAIGIYGDRGAEKLTEKSKLGDDFLARLCRDWEAAAAPAAEAGIRVALLRTGIVLAPGGGALEKLLPLFKLGLGGRMGSGDQFWSWITLEDEVRAIRHLIDGNVSGPVNLTAPEPETNHTLTSTLGEVLHRPTFFPIPRFGPKILLGGEATETFLYASTRRSSRATGSRSATPTSSRGCDRSSIAS
jgi:uncharacterized protein (TIGR01777 family)